MRLIKTVSIFITLSCISCVPKSNSNSSVPASPPQVVEETVNELYLDPRNLIKSLENKKNLNSVKFHLEANNKPTQVFVPFYFNSETYSSFKVTKPVFWATGCQVDEIQLGASFGIPMLGADNGHNPGEPKVLMAYGVKEDLGNFNSDQTVTIVFQTPPNCTDIKFEFESQFD